LLFGPNVAYVIVYVDNEFIHSKRCSVPALAENKQTASREPRTTVAPKILFLRCMVYCKEPAHYLAECIDLDITVRGSTPQEAEASLKSAIEGYLHVAFNGDERGLVPRPAPLSHRARYHLFALRAALSIGVRNFLLCDFTAPGASFC
jgi:predicted RNase H-like HicB family nuclease